MFKKFKDYMNTTLGGVLIHMLLAGAILFTLAAVYFYVYLPSVTNHNETITVPNIEGMSYDRLEEFLGERVTMDFRFHERAAVEAALERAGLEVRARLERRGDPAVEHPSLRAYLLARRPES